MFPFYHTNVPFEYLGICSLGVRPDGHNDVQKKRLGHVWEILEKTGGDFFSECAMKTIKLYNITEADRNIYLDDYPESSNLFKTI